MPIQQMLLGVGGAATKTYVDDVFSTYVYTGTGANRSINNGIDLSGEGGMVWFKARDNSYSHGLFDTERGASLFAYSNSNAAQVQNTTTLTAFNNNGFSLGADTAYGIVNTSTSDDYASWTFRKAKKFFTICEWTGNATNRTISHDLGCIPGMILIKRTDVAADWMVYHRSLNGGTNPGNYRLHLNTAVAENTASTVFNNTEPTSTTFSIGSHYDVNGNNGTFVAYVFAGGEEGYNSVEFDAATESLSATSSDYAFGTGDFTVEAWIKIPNVSGISYQNILDTRGSINNSTSGFSFGVQSNGQLYMYTNGFIINTAVNTITSNQWYHIALVNNGGTAKAYVDGVEKGSVSLSGYDFTNTTFRIANVDSSSGQNFVGSISNVRVVKGTAVYTSAFTAPTAPLTNITNTKLLCCNGDLATSSTVASGTLSASGSPNTTGTSPFTSADSIFGESESPVIKCGSYIGNGDGQGPEINLGFEPSWILLKNATASSRDWKIVDAMRGIVTGGNDASLRPNESNDEDDESVIDLTPTGFKITASNAHYNENGERIIYVAIRRPDGYVGKPAELGTDVFFMNTFAASGVPKLRSSNFPLDFATMKTTASVNDWITGSRLTGTSTVNLNSNTAASDNSYWEWDYMDGFHSYDSGDLSAWQGWAWKRHAGFDLVTWTGNGVHGRQIPHSMNNTAQMLWIKRRSGVNAWATGHIGLNGGTNPWNYYVGINETSQETDDDGMFADTAPTSTHFTTGAHSQVNSSGETYIAMLFASVDKISAVGSYTGNGSNSGAHVTVGFTPRFLWVKRTDVAGSWYVVDTLRGLSSSSANDDTLYFNQNVAQTTGQNWVQTSNTGFTPLVNWSAINADGGKYIYYAHA